MFQKYTEKARRTIFFGRFEASQLGSPYIESEHLLLGLLREYKGLTQRFLKNAGATELIRKQIEDTAAAGKKPPISTSVDLPLSNECKRVLAYAAEEAERFSHQHIGCEHLLVGLLREEKSLAAEILRRCGLSESVVREELARSTGASFSPALEHAGETKSSLEFGPDLVAQASNDQQPPLVGRETELEQLIRILGRFKKNNPVLLGEPGVGKRAIVEGLARLIARGELPAGLRYQSIVALDLAMVILNARDRDRYHEFMHELLYGPPGALFLIEGLERVAGSGVSGKSLEIVHILKPALLRGTIQCIGITTPTRYPRLLEAEPWVERCFEPVAVKELSEAEALQVLLATKKRYETFHGITYTEEALLYAVFLSNGYVVNRSLPDKALDLIDEAGTWMKLNQPQVPQEVKDCQKRLKFVTDRMESAVSNHEFEKARFYSDEVRKEQEALNLLREKHKINDVSVVTRETIEEVISRRTGIPVSAIRKSRLTEPQA